MPGSDVCDASLLKKSRESLYLMGLCVSLMLEICGVMIFIAKKGGISLEVVHFLYFSKAVQTRLQYFLITLNQLGYLIAIGRFLFPLFLVEMALKLSMVPAIRRNGRLQLFAALVPAAMLILYFPPIYRILVAGNEALQKTFATLSRFWIDLYLLFAIGLLLYELFSITLKFVRRQFVQVTLFLIALTGIYICITIRIQDRYTAFTVIQQPGTRESAICRSRHPFTATCFWLWSM